MKYTGILSSTASNDIDFNEVELVLGFVPNTLLDITFEATVTVSGQYIPQSYWMPAEYEEISDTEIVNIYFNFESGEILATPSQLRIMETFKPESQEVFWDLVQKETA
jgi:hypothetical protein